MNSLLRHVHSVIARTSYSLGEFSSLFVFVGLEFYKHGKKSLCRSIHAVDGSESAYISTWDEKPYETLPGRKRAYLDEQDILTVLDPPKELIPLDPESYNPAAYLWSVFYIICLTKYSGESNCLICEVKCMFL